MNVMIKTVLDQIKGVELWIAAFPLVRCLIEGHQRKPLPRITRSDVEPIQLYCERCHLVFWE